MTTEETPKRKRKPHNRSKEYERLKIARAEAAARKEFAAGGMADRVLEEAEERKIQLAALAKRTAEQPTDADRDIDFAYKNSGNPSLTPLMAPSLGAWQWYEYARNLPDKFLEICAKREDAKAKQAGTITSQRMEDDRRQQFAVIDRIIKQLQVDVKAIAKDLMTKCPEDLLNECRKHVEPWKRYFENHPL